MRRFVGTVLIGLGALFIVVAVGLPLYVAPAVTKLPNDLHPCKQGEESGCVKPVVAEAVGAHFLQIKLVNGAPDINVNTATLRSTLEVVPQPKLTAEQQKAGKLSNDAMVWDVYLTTLRTDTNELIGAYSTELALDRVSGAAVDWSGQWLDVEHSKDTEIRYTNQIYKFPFGTEKTDYKIYDIDLRTALPAKFTSVENLDGVEVYHFVQEISTTKVEVAPDSLSILLGRFAPGATSGRVTYSNIREVWVDPITGSYIKVRERPKQQLEPDTGTPTVLLDADFTYTKQTIAESAQFAKDGSSQLKLVKLYGPVGLGIVGLVTLIGGLLLALGRGRPVREPTAWDTTLPNARHSLRGE